MWFAIILAKVQLQLLLMTENSKPSLVEMKSEMSAMKKELEETKQLLLQMMKTSPFLPENQAKLMGSLQS